MKSGCTTTSFMFCDEYFNVTQVFRMVRTGTLVSLLQLFSTLAPRGGKWCPQYSVLPIHSLLPPQHLTSIRSNSDWWTKRPKALNKRLPSFDVRTQNLSQISKWLHQSEKYLQMSIGIQVMMYHIYVKRHITEFTYFKSILYNLSKHSFFLHSFFSGYPLPLWTSSQGFRNP